MGWLQDLLQEVQLSGVLLERVKAAEEQYTQQITSLTQRVAHLEKENAGLRDQLPKPSEVQNDTTRVLLALFRAPDIDHREVRVISRQLEMERSVLQYHLDQLEEAGLATLGGGNYVTGAVYWSLTPAGRKKVVEERLA